MVDKMAFLKAYNIDEDDFKAADISWEELAAIYDDYLLKEEKLRGIGKDFVNDYLYDIERAGIHSYRYRTKNPGHLLEKIIRKRKEDPEKFKDLNRSNYYKYMTQFLLIILLWDVRRTGRRNSWTYKSGIRAVSALSVCKAKKTEKRLLFFSLLYNFNIQLLTPVFPTGELYTF